MDEWYGADLSPGALGDGGPWTRWLPLAWHAAADPDGAHQLPSKPPPGAPTGELIAWWSPLPQLVGYGLGWRLPAQGLAAWHAKGRPTDEPLLAVVDRWWGEEIIDFIAWGMESSLDILPQREPDAEVSPVDPEIARLVAVRKREHGWASTWSGGWDPLHLTTHVVGPGQRAAAASVAVTLADNASPRPLGALVQDTYPGWYAALCDHSALSAPTSTGRNRRVDVTVRALGWMGTFRRSTVTGLWFRGRHRTHMLGYG